MADRIPFIRTAFQKWNREQYLRNKDTKSYENRKIYNNQRWRKFRQWYLTIHPLCVICGTVANTVDHIKSINSGGLQYDVDNCQSMCHSCHSQKTVREDGAFRGQINRNKDHNS